MRTALDALYESANLHLLELVESAYGQTRTKTESPIEDVFIKALALYYLMNHASWLGVNERKSDDNWHVQTQAQIGSYRVDFLLTPPEVKRRYVIECDGHDFHERTKEQAARDRARDRDLVSDGYVVLRFTGSEIWRDPWGCAMDVETQIMNEWHRESTS